MADDSTIYLLVFDGYDSTCVTSAPYSEITRVLLPELLQRVNVIIVGISSILPLPKQLGVPFRWTPLELDHGAYMASLALSWNPPGEAVPALTDTEQAILELSGLSESMSVQNPQEWEDISQRTKYRQEAFGCFHGKNHWK